MGTAFISAILLLATFPLILNAYAQLYGNANPVTTSEQFEQCKILGIGPQKCTEQEILSRYCLGGPNSQCGGTGRPPDLDSAVLSILVGSGVAFVMGILYVRRIGKFKGVFYRA
jgi:hypothetical protein